MGERDDVMDLLARSLRAAVEDPACDLTYDVFRMAHEALSRYFEWQRRDDRLD